MNTNPKTGIPEFKITKTDGINTFWGTFDGYELLFEQYDGPITINMDQLKEVFGDEFSENFPGLIEHLIKIAEPVIRDIKYRFQLLNVFSEN